MQIKAFAFDAYGTLFDTRSVMGAVEARFPRRGALITQLWRLKQLEYSWLRTAMGRYADFPTVTREALRFALDLLAPEADEGTISALCGAFDRLDLFADAAGALSDLRPYRLAILSNGSPAMLDALLSHAACRDRFEAVVSTASAQVFKPHPEAYRALTDALGLRPDEIALVSSNGFDVAGAKSYGLRTIRIARMAPDRLRERLGDGDALSPDDIFAAQRALTERLTGEPDVTCASLRDLAAVARAMGVPASPP